MKKLHRSDLYGWSEFNADRNIDFHSVLWVRDGGNVVVDPLPMSEHDRAHLTSLGTLGHIVITNSDHTRDVERLARETGAVVYGPAGERDGFPIACARWLADGDEVVPGLSVVTMDGSKTPGELALVLDSTTLITGDLIRAHEAGKLCLIPDAKLSNKTQAVASLRKLVANHDLEAVLPGDGWPVFRNASDVLRELSDSL